MADAEICSTNIVINTDTQQISCVICWGDIFYLQEDQMSDIFVFQLPNTFERNVESQIICVAAIS